MDETRNDEFSTLRLKHNRYPGRGIIVGQTSDLRHFVQIYWIMGRSPNSRNRIFERDNNWIETKAFDPSKLEDPSLIIYYPMKDINGNHIVANGDQTETIYQYLSRNDSFENALRTRSFEPDAPHYTPRISGIIYTTNAVPRYTLSILKSSSNDSSICLRTFFEYSNFKSGIGHCIHTYTGYEEPLFPFTGEPFEVSIFDDITQNAEYYWNQLDIENRISLVVKFVSAKSGSIQYKITNKNL
jgi:IMP cyclohydrolase